MRLERVSSPLVVKHFARVRDGRLRPSLFRLHNWKRERLAFLVAIHSENAQANSLRYDGLRRLQCVRGQIGTVQHGIVIDAWCRRRNLDVCDEGRLVWQRRHVHHIHTSRRGCRQRWRGQVACTYSRQSCDFHCCAHEQFPSLPRASNASIMAAVVNRARRGVGNIGLLHERYVLVVESDTGWV